MQLATDNADPGRLRNYLAVIQGSGNEDFLRFFERFGFLIRISSKDAL
jgi:hypothetical protein